MEPTLFPVQFSSVQFSSVQVPAPFKIQVKPHLIIFHNIAHQASTTRFSHSFVHDCTVVFFSPRCTCCWCVVNEQVLCCFHGGSVYVLTAHNE
jgi:hypothetical protein